jgi:hypothetical protein
MATVREPSRSLRGPAAIEARPVASAPATTKPITFPAGDARLEFKWGANDGRVIQPC